MAPALAGGCFLILSVPLCLRGRFGFPISVISANQWSTSAASVPLCFKVLGSLAFQFSLLALPAILAISFFGYHHLQRTPFPVMAPAHQSCRIPSCRVRVVQNCGFRIQIQSSRAAICPASPAVEPRNPETPLAAASPHSPALAPSLQTDTPRPARSSAPSPAAPHTSASITPDSS